MNKGYNAFILAMDIGRAAMERLTVSACDVRNVRKNFKNNQCRTIFDSLTEQEILRVQELFLTNGIHELEVLDVSTGREIITTFLHSLNWYHSAACLSVQELPPHSSITDIYRLLLCQDYLGDNGFEKLDVFFSEDFYFDFLWIEKTPELCAAPWFNYFEYKLHSLEGAYHMPIIEIRYYQ